MSADKSNVDATATSDVRVQLPTTLTGAAVALLVVSILWSIFSLFGIAYLLPTALSPDSDAELRADFLMYAGVLGVEILYSCLLISGGFGMIRRGSYAWALVTSCLAMVPILSPFYFLGIPIGIWCLMLLRRPGVKAAFAKP